MEELFWTLGPSLFTTAGWILVILSCLLMFCSIMIGAANFAFRHHFPGFTLGVCLLGALAFGVAGIYASAYLPPSAEKQTYVSEEHKLASVGNLREQESETTTTHALFYYASTTKVENVETLRFIRENQDERGTYYTVESRPMDEVRVYQSNDETPVERHWHTRIVMTNPYTGEQHFKSDRLDLIEIKVPEGSVTNDYDLSVSQ